MKIYLKFANEAAYLAAFAPLMSTVNGVSIIPPYLTFDTSPTAVKVVGVIYSASGNTLTTPEGLEYPEMLPLPGYHVNLLGECPESLTSFVIPTPATPSVDWA